MDFRFPENIVFQIEKRYFIPDGGNLL